MIVYPNNWKKDYSDYADHDIEIQSRAEYSFLSDALKEFQNNNKVKQVAGSKYIALKKLVQKIATTKGPNGMMGYTANFMHQLNHSHYSFSTRELVQQGWDELKPLFMFILSTLPEEEK